MSRFFQNNNGTIDFLHNNIIEKIICISWSDKNREEDLLSIWLKIKAKNFWVRFFLDAGICFGEKYNLSEFKYVYAEDIDENYSYSFSDRNKLNDKIIILAKVCPVGDRGGVELSFYLDNNQIISIVSEVFDGNTKILLSR